MRHDTGRRYATLAAGILGLAFAAPAAAQAWNYPSFQTPQVLQREYNFGLASGGDAGGTQLVGQWREGMSALTGFSLDAGIADPKGGDTRFFIGGAIHHRILKASADMPLDLLVTGGFYPSFGDPATAIRIPIGATLGHRFPLEGNGQMAIIPYAHPRLSFDLCAGGDDKCGNDKTNLSINFEGGLDFEFSRQASIRFAFVFPGGSDVFEDAAFGFSFAFRPRGVSAGK